MWIAGAATMLCLSVTVVVLALSVARLSARLVALEAKAAPEPAPSVRNVDEERAARLERERDDLRQENLALKKAIEGVSSDSAGVGASESRQLRTQALSEAAQGRYQDARWHLTQAVALDATDARSWWLLSFTHLATGSYREAGEAFSRALQLGQRGLFGPEQNPSLRFKTREEYERYLRGLEEYVTAHPEDLHARTLLAYHHFFERGPNYAQALLVEVLQSPGGAEFEPARTLSAEMQR
ncbi:MAG: hypothetical protein HYY16_12860 [Planctomycetes bacterium]|nr:hypothetical protein [Planctomycetota bacterium]